MAVMDQILPLLRAAGGRVGFYAKNLVTGETLAWGEDQALLAASVIKIPILVECFARMEAGELDKAHPFTVAEEAKMPSCGALTYMHTGLTVTLEDLYTLMIILSDNTATNMLIDFLGMDAIDRRLESLGLTGTRLNRRLFDEEASRRGIENTIVPREIAALLEQMEAGTLVSPAASREMLRILRCQRLNNKIPVLLPPGTPVAHKTGEDDGITHDVGIIYGEAPFILCLCANGVERGPFERDMQVIARLLWDAWEPEA